MYVDGAFVFFCSLELHMPIVLIHLYCIEKNSSDIQHNYWCVFYRLNEDTDSNRLKKD